MASMAQTQGMGSPDRIPPRKPLSHEVSQDSSYRNSFETPDGSEARHSIPQIITAPSRIQDAPMSPVRINYQNEEWAQPSTVQIENMTTRMNDARISGQGRDSQQYQGGSEGTVRQAAHRQVYPEQGQRHASHAGVLSNARGSPQPYNEESPQNGRRSDDSSSSAGVMNVPPLQYHHLPHRSVDSQRNQSPGDDYTGRHLTPLSTDQARRSYMQRPQSTYSAYSDQPLNRGPSPRYDNGPRRTPDGSRPGSFVELSGQYPQVAPTFDNSGLRAVVGNNASLLSTDKTFEMYRANLKNNNDPETHYSFALLLVDAAKEKVLHEPQGALDRKPSPKLGRDLESPYVETQASTSQELIREAKKILERLADRFSYPYAQYFLADGYASGFFNKGKEDYDKAFGLFVAASKHGHAESAYRAALCYEFGWGTRKDVQKAHQFYKTAAVKNHPGAMTRLGRAGLAGDLGEATEREAIKWLKRATESADLTHFDAPFWLARLYENGYGDDIFKDETYAAQLYTQAADLGHPEAAFRLGEAYEHGALGCPRDPSLSVHFYTMAAAKGHPTAMFNLCAWYMVGAEPVLEKDEDEAYEWAKRAADAGMFEKFHYDLVSFCNHGFIGIFHGEDSTGRPVLTSFRDPRIVDSSRTASQSRPGASAARGLLANKASVSKLESVPEGRELDSASLRFIKRYWPEEAMYEDRYRTVKGVKKPAPKPLKPKSVTKYGWVGGWPEEVVLEARAQLLKAGVFPAPFERHHSWEVESGLRRAAYKAQFPIHEPKATRSNFEDNLLPAASDESSKPHRLSKSLSWASLRGSFGSATKSSDVVSGSGSHRAFRVLNRRSMEFEEIEEIETPTRTSGTSIASVELEQDSFLRDVIPYSPFGNEVDVDVGYDGVVAGVASNAEMDARQISLQRPSESRSKGARSMTKDYVTHVANLRARTPIRLLKLRADAAAARTRARVSSLSSARHASAHLPSRSTQARERDPVAAQRVRPLGASRNRPPPMKSILKESKQGVSRDAQVALAPVGSSSVSGDMPRSRSGSKVRFSPSTSEVIRSIASVSSSLPPVMPRGALRVCNPSPADSSVGGDPSESGVVNNRHSSESMPESPVSENSVLVQDKRRIPYAEGTSLDGHTSSGSRPSVSSPETRAEFAKPCYIGEFAVAHPSFVYPFGPSDKSRFMDQIFGLAKAEYAVGYFTEMGIGCRRDPLEANVWYVHAAEKGEQRAIERLKKIAQEAEGGPHSQGVVPGKGGKKLDVSKIGKKEAKMSTKELKKKVEEGRLAGLSAGLPIRASSLPAGARELQMPLVTSSGNANAGDNKLAKPPGSAGKDKDCIVM